MEKKIKICFLYESVFTLGGVQTCITTIANYLIKQGYDITILCSNVNVEENRATYGLDQNIKVIFITKRSCLKRIIYKVSNAILKFNRKTGILKKNLNLLKKFIIFTMEKI